MVSEFNWDTLVAMIKKSKRRGGLFFTDKLQ